MKRIMVFALCLALCLTAIVMPATAETEKVYRTYMTMDYRTLNVHNCTEGNMETLVSYTGAALYRAVPDADGKGYHYEGDLAAELPVKIDANNWQISIDPAACWANGEAINADTIIYSYKMMLDPVLVNNMSNFISKQNIEIVKAVEYAAQGTAATVAWDEVGIKKIDEYTIQITTVAENTQTDVMAHFAARTASPVYQPYYEAGMSSDGSTTTYGVTLDQYMACGPYILQTWVNGSQQIYVKNDKYLHADKYNYTSIEVSVLADSNAAVEKWEKGELDDYTPDSNTIETYIDDPRLVEYTSNTVHHIDVSSENPDNPLCKSNNYRKALYYAMDREILADLFGYKQPTGTYVSGQAGILSESRLTYRESEYGKAVTAMVESWGPYGYNPELAREYMQAAFEECGVAEGTVITLKFGVDPTDGAWGDVCEYLQQSLEEVFDGMIKINLDTYSGISCTAYKKQTYDWDLTHNEWARSAARTYPYQIFYYYTSQYSNHPNNYLDADFDAQYAVCESLAQDYMACLAETQKLEEVYLDKVINIPIVQEVSFTLFSDRLELPVSTYIPGFGWGTLFGDIAE